MANKKKPPPAEAKINLKLDALASQLAQPSGNAPMVVSKTNTRMYPITIQIQEELSDDILAMANKSGKRPKELINGWLETMLSRGQWNNPELPTLEPDTEESFTFKCPMNLRSMVANRAFELGLRTSDLIHGVCIQMLKESK